MRIKKYESLVGENCLLASFANSLKVINSAIEDSSIFFLQDGFKINYEMDISMDSFILRFSHHFDKIVESFMEKYNIKYTKENIWDNENEFIHFLKERFNSGHPFLIYVSSKNLKYCNNYILNKERVHAINLIGMTDAGIIISDSYVPTFPTTAYEGLLDFNELYEIFRWNKNSEYKCYNIDYNSIDHDSLNILPDVVREGIKRNLNNYFDLSREDAYLKALNRLSYDLLGIHSFPELGQKLEELSYKIFVESVIPARNLLRKALINLADEKSINLSSSIITDLDNNIKKWYSITLMLIKAGMKPKKEHFEKLYDKVRMHIYDEQELFNKIYQITNKG